VPLGTCKKHFGRRWALGRAKEYEALSGTSFHCLPRVSSGSGQTALSGGRLAPNNNINNVNNNNNNNNNTPENTSGADHSAKEKKGSHGE